MVLATQNPIEQEGTYPPPEAQLDRFMVQLTVGYPSREEEERIVAETTTDDSVDVRPVLTAAQRSDLLHLVRRLPAAPSVVSYAVQLARSTRPDAPEAPANIKKYVSWGAGREPNTGASAPRRGRRWTGAASRSWRTRRRWRRRY